MKSNRISRRGFSSLMATIFVALFAVLAISFVALSNINVQMARNHRDVNSALSAAESGLEYLHNLMFYYVDTYGIRTFSQQVTEDDAYALFEDLHDFLQVELNGSTMLEGAVVGTVTNFAEGSRTGHQIVVPNVTFADGERGRFSIQIRQYFDDPMTLEAISIGTMGGLDRRILIQYDLVKDKRLLEFSVVSKSPVNITDNSLVGTGIYTDWRNPEIAPPVTLSGVSTIDGDISTVLDPEDFEGLGYTMEDVAQGAYDEIQYGEAQVDMPTAEDFDTSMYSKECSVLSSGHTYNVKEYYPHAPGSYTTPLPNSVELNRTVYENMVISEKRAISGNALFINCVFDGTFYIGTTDGIGTNNVRFENCTFNGPIVTGVPPKFGPEDWKKNALYFTGDCVFNNTSMEEATILAPNYNVDIGNGTGTSTLTGLVLGGVVDIGGDATVDGTIVSMADPLELGAYAGMLDTTIGTSDEGTHNLGLTPSPDRLLPMGISMKILIVRDGNSFVELEN
jgi:hypothetical protein